MTVPPKPVRAEPVEAPSFFEPQALAQEAERPFDELRANGVITGADPLARLESLVALAPGRIVFTTSFGLEDQALTHIIATAALPLEIVTLDTGRLFSETHALWAETEARYGRRIKAFYPDAQAVSDMVADAGINGFYWSKEARLSCCGVRKVEPLNRALAGAGAWVTGLRADQSDGRGLVELAAHDAARGLLKVAPLYDWTRARTLAFCEDAGVPINPLHAQGFLSIGCQPCTRAVAPGEPERAGRWWWEQDGSQECGLHLVDGRLTRVPA